MIYGITLLVASEQVEFPRLCLEWMGNVCVYGSKVGKIYIVVSFW